MLALYAVMISTAQPTPEVSMILTSSGDSSSGPVASIAGGVVGGIVAVVIAVVLVLLLIILRNRRKLRYINPVDRGPLWLVFV